MFRVNCGIRAKMHAPVHELAEGAAAEFFAEVDGGGDDQCFENVDRGDSCNFAESRARMSVRRRSRNPRDRGVAHVFRPSVSRAARTASSESDSARHLWMRVLPGDRTR